MKDIIFKKFNGKYKIPWFIRFKFNSKQVFKFEYNNKLYDKSIESSDKEVRQVSLLVEALNIKKKNRRLEFVYDKTCDLLDEVFYGKNVCEFKNGKCAKDRLCNNLGGGCCCDSENHLSMCPYLTNQGCSVRCLACKFHVCKIVKSKGYKYRLNDIYMIKYLYSWKQKIMCLNDFFMSKEECLKNIYRNSIIFWIFCKKNEFIKYNTD